MSLSPYHSILVPVFLTALTARPVGAEFLYVPSVYESIQAAVDASTDPTVDVVIIESGHYDVGWIKVPAEKSGLTLRGASGSPNDVVLANAWCSADGLIRIEAVSFAGEVAWLFPLGGSPEAVLEMSRCRALCTLLVGTAPFPVIYWSSVAFDDCEFLDGVTAACDREVRLDRCEVTGGQVVVSARSVTVADTRLSDLDWAHFEGYRGASAFERVEISGTSEFFTVSAVEVVFAGCTIRNSHGNPGLSVRESGGGLVALFRDCLFLGNDAGALRLDSGDIAVQNCTFRGNFGNLGSAISWHALCDLVPCSGVRGSLRIDQCTFDNNGGCHVLWGTAQPGTQLEVSRSILFGARGAPAIDTNGAQTPWIECTDIFGNEGGDWTGSWASQKSERGNLAADPEFCSDDRDTDLDWSLRETTPARCGSGVMGSESRTCSAPSSIEGRSWGALKALYR